MNMVNENKLFTVLLNRRTIFAIALFCSTLLPSNQAAPTPIYPSHLNGDQTEMASIPATESPPPSLAATQTQSQLNGTIPTDNVNGKFVSTPADSSPLPPLSPLAQLSSWQIEKMLLSNKQSPITEKTDDSKQTTASATASSSNNYYRDGNNHSDSPINILLSTPQTPSIDNDFINGKINAHNKMEQQHNSSPPPSLPPLSTATNHGDNVAKETAATALPTHEIAQHTTGTVVQPTQSVSPISPEFTLKPTDDNVTPSSSVSTGNDGLASNINKQQKSETNNPLLTQTMGMQTNGKVVDAATPANENHKPFEPTIDTNVGHQGATHSPTLIKNASPANTDATTATATSGPSTIQNTNNNSYGTKITKVFDEEKSSSKKVKQQESLNNNHKKYNNKHNKDKSKKKAHDDDDDADRVEQRGSEEGGGGSVHQTNGKLSDNLLMTVIPSTTVPGAAIPFGSDIASVGAAAATHATTIRYPIESHFTDGISSQPNKIFDGIHTEPMINVDVTNSNLAPPVASAAPISTTTEFSTKTENAQLESSTIERHIEPLDSTSSTIRASATETKDSISETTMLNEKPATIAAAAAAAESNVSNQHSSGDGNNEMNKTDNELMRTFDAATVATHLNNESTKSTIKSPTSPPPPRPSILDYDKSSEEIFDIVRETSTIKTEISSVVAQKRPTDGSTNDEFFLPADDLDTDTMATMSAPVTVSPTAAATTTKATTTTTTTIQSTIPINTESAIVRPSSVDSLVPTITASIPIVTVADTKQQQQQRPQQTTDQNKSSTISRDSDTIFYISNTEVKVVESSVPTPNSKQENQFFPALFEEDVIIDFPNKNSSGWNNGLDGLNDKYEEDIILSPMKNNFNFDPTKLNDENLSISYVGESFIDIKEATSSDDTADASNAQTNDISDESKETSASRAIFGGDNAISSNVIIEPAIIPDIGQQQQQQSIGVPIIGELPSQINIHDLDYKSSESATIQLNNSGNSISSHFPMHAGDNLQKARELTAELPKTDSEEIIGAGTIDELDDDRADIGKNETQKANTTAESITNVTAYSSVLDKNPTESSK